MKLLREWEATNYNIIVAAVIANLYVNVVCAWPLNTCNSARAWICVLDAPGCYEREARAERKVGPCAQRGVA